MDAPVNNWHERRINAGEVVRGGFIVFRRGTSLGRIKINPNKPPFEHATLEKATSERDRLAHANPGVEFSVFQMVSTLTVPATEQEG
jgi:hypothetical protein